MKSLYIIYQLKSSKDVKKLRFLHTADLHIGLKYSSGIKEETRKLLFENQLKVLKNIVDISIERKADVLLIAGDLFDSSSVSKELGDRVFKILGECSIPVLIACGNHDPKVQGSIYEKCEIPENIYIFKEEVEKYSFDDFDVYGMSFISSHKTDNSFVNFMAEDSSRINILLTHGETVKESFYNPVDVSSLSEKGIDYLALGHIHKEDGVKKYKNMYYAYSGSPQNLSFKETEKASVIYGEIDKERGFFEKISVFENEFKNIMVDITDSRSNDDIISLIMKEVSKSDISRTLFKVNLQGKIIDCFIYSRDEIENSLSDKLIHIECEENFGYKYDIELLKSENSIKGEFVRNALLILSDKDEDYINSVIEYGVSHL